MTTSNNTFRACGRTLCVAALYAVLALGLPTTGRSPGWAYAAGTQTSGQHQQVTQAGQEQAAGLHDPERGRDRPEKRDRARLMLSPATSVVAPGDEFEVRLLVVGAQELLRLPATLHYDPEVMRVVSVRAGSAWKNGSAPALMYDTRRPGELVIGLARLGREASPITGGGELLLVSFAAVAAGEGELTLKRFALLGHGARSQRAEARPAKVSVK